MKQFFASRKFCTKNYYAENSRGPLFNIIAIFFIAIKQRNFYSVYSKLYRIGLEYSSSNKRKEVKCDLRLH